VDVKLANGEALAGREVEASGHAVHLQVALDAAALLEGVLIAALVLALALLDFVHCHIPLAQPVGVQHFLARVAAARLDC